MKMPLKLNCIKAHVELYTDQSKLRIWHHYESHGGVEFNHEYNWIYSSSPYKRDDVKPIMLNSTLFHLKTLKVTIKIRIIKVYSDESLVPSSRWNQYNIHHNQ